MYLSLNIPALSKPFPNLSIPNLDSIVQIIFTIIVFFYIAIDLVNSSNEFNYLTLCKNVLEELEKEKLSKIKNESDEINEFRWQ